MLCVTAFVVRSVVCVVVCGVGCCVVVLVLVLCVGVVCCVCVWLCGCLCVSVCVSHTLSRSRKTKTYRCTCRRHSFCSLTFHNGFMVFSAARRCFKHFSRFQDPLAL